MTSDDLRQLLTAFQQGNIALEEILPKLSASDTSLGFPATAQVDGVQIDLERECRCGFPEVVYAPGKSTRTLIEIFTRLLEAGQDCLATRVSTDQAVEVLKAFPESVHNPEGRTVRISHEREARGHVLVVTAGTSDRPVAEEALETLRWMHCGCELIVDVGVAGPRRLLAQLPKFESADAVIVVAGMEGALPSVVGGWVDCPVIAVPTSVGYGASFNGLTALLGMLNSCAANVAVVNIDAGFKAGYLAGMIARSPRSEGE